MMVQLTLRGLEVKNSNIYILAGSKIAELFREKNKSIQFGI
jgi:hypothetical protein